ncbi:hypothetical protein [Candidatus Thioglobus sp.]|uniref:hypothetical protein n=1 Tax=Candidatus Thioglobus sp. TaxID=2026721 RepID=UPI00262B26BA|nr:hypothetical protein [Candidatus Thioglobus sp.]MDG2395883.1 hypothetical protein [Candidatus Thioglobus sp.]
MKEAGFGIFKTCIGLTLAISTTVGANFGDPSSMMSSFGGQGFAQPQMQPFGNSMPQMQPFGNSTPFGGQSYNQPRYSNSRYASPRQRYNTQPAYNPMPWAMGGDSGRKAQPTQSFGGMSMMPFNPGVPSQQPAQKSQSAFMMPGMDQGIRTMMEPGKIMAEEATPGVYMKPTWR